MPALRFEMLGTFAGWCDHQPLLLPPTLKSQSLLAYLILQRARPQPRERLIGMYWPEHPEERARRSLTTALWHIRRCLPDDGLLSDTQQVQFNPALALWLDVDEFRARAAQNNLDSLAAAGRLYRGDFLDGFYDDWIVEERNRLLDVLVAALGRLAAGYEQAGAAGAALDAALRLLAQEPLQEEAHRLVMRAYCRLGRRGRALEQYERCRDELRQELDTDPAPETIALYRAILDGSFAAGPVAPAGILPAAEPPARPAPGARHPLEGLTPGRMVGREADLAAIAARWRDACAGHGGLLLIEGEAGVGKTRLVEEFARQVERWDLPVLRGRCFEFERSLPYQPFPDLMHTGLQLMAPRALAACPPWALAEAARLAPELAETARAGAGTEPAPAALGAATDPERLFEGLLRFFIALAAGKPLLIILDDLHWAGRSCLQLIHFLTRHIATQPILLAGTFRPEALAPRHPLVALQRDLQTEGLGAVQPLLPLPRAAVETMVRELSGNAEAAAPLAARLCDETEGNPFFLIELLRALVEAGVIRVDPQTWQIDLARLGQAGRPLPAGVAQAIQARTAGLTTPAREALQYAAVLGQEFDFAALERMWGHGEEATLAALDQLLRRRMLLESSGSLSRDYSFTHKLIQEAVVAGLSRRTRLHLHALAAAALEQVYAGQLAAMAGELGFHYRQAQEHDPAVAGKAVAYLILAGDRARDVDMLREAIDYYEQALGLLRAQPPGEQAARVCMKLGLVRHWLRDFREADAAYREGFALWQRAARAQAGDGLPPAPHALRMEWPEPAVLDLLNDHLTEPGYIISQLCSGLVEVSPDMEVIPAIARSWEILDEGRRYVFHLDESARWSDGHPLTAADFELAWRLILAPATAAFLAPDYYVIRGARAYHQGGAEAPAIRAPAEHTLEIELEAPATYFLELVSTVVPVPGHCLEAYGQEWLAPAPLVTNGAFRLEHWEHGRSMTLVRNPYCRLPTAGNIERIELAFNPLEDWQGSLARYEADALDVLDIGAIPTPAAQTIKGRHADEYRSWPSRGLYVLFLDCNRPPFDHPGVRRAFVHAIDREALAYESLGGADSPATGGLVPPSLRAHSPGIGLAYDPDLARRLLAEAGYPGGRGLPRIRCAVEYDRTAPAIGAYLQQQWAAVLGVESQWTDAGPAHVEGRAGNDEMQVTLIGVAWIYADPDTCMRLIPMTLGHLSHWQDPDYDRLVDESTRTLDRPRRFALLQRADRILMEGAAVVPLVYPRLHLLVKPWVQRLISFADFPPHLRHVVIEPH